MEDGILAGELRCTQRRQTDVLDGKIRSKKIM